MQPSYRPGPASKSSHRPLQGAPAPAAAVSRQLHPGRAAAPSPPGPTRTQGNASASQHQGRGVSSSSGTQDGECEHACMLAPGTGDAARRLHTRIRVHASTLNNLSCHAQGVGVWWHGQSMRAPGSQRLVPASRTYAPCVHAQTRWRREGLRRTLSAPPACCMAWRRECRVCLGGLRGSGSAAWAWC